MDPGGNSFSSSLIYAFHRGGMTLNINGMFRLKTKKIIIMETLEELNV
jgi:hypothetical protein